MFWTVHIFWVVNSWGYVYIYIIKMFMLYVVTLTVWYVSFACTVEAAGYSVDCMLLMILLSRYTALVTEVMELPQTKNWHSPISPYLLQPKDELVSAIISIMMANVLIPPTIMKPYFVRELELCMPVLFTYFTSSHTTNIKYKVTFSICVRLFGQSLAFL